MVGSTVQLPSRLSSVLGAAPSGAADGSAEGACARTVAVGIIESAVTSATAAMLARRAAGRAGAIMGAPLLVRGSASLSQGTGLKLGPGDAEMVETAPGGMTGAPGPMGGGSAGRKKKYQTVPAATRMATANRASTTARVRRPRQRLAGAWGCDGGGMTCPPPSPRL